MIPDDMRGRATGAYSTINYGIRPLGAIVGGLLGSTIGIRPTFVPAAAGAALSILWLLRSPLLRVRAITDLDGIIRAPACNSQRPVLHGPTPVPNAASPHIDLPIRH